MGRLRTLYKLHVAGDQPSKENRKFVVPLAIITFFGVREVADFAGHIRYLARPMSYARLQVPHSFRVGFNQIVSDLD
jgi:hypothetical protein